MAVALIVLVLLALVGCGVVGIGWSLRLWRTAGASRRPVLRRVLAGVALLVGAYLLLLGLGLWLNPF
ncbi:MAG: hypothetical protein M3256_26625 [Actinomycetota bacterium]|nr:hypothetical protein [Actinomycetota bacterium]